VKAILGCASLLIVMSATAAGDDGQERLVQEMQPILQQFVDVLKGVKDKNTALAALPKVDAIAERIKKLRELFPLTLTPEERKKLDRIQMPDMKNLEREIARIDTIRDAYSVLKTTFYFKHIRELKEEIARVQIRNLEVAITALQIRNGTYPLKLAELTEKKSDGAPVLEADSLLDPWQRPYQYDYDGPKNGRRKPDIWSLGHPGEKDAVIGNWSVQKKKSDDKGL